MENLNQTQIKVLAKLLFSPKARFKDLNTDHLSTDSFSYYIKSLIKTGLIRKDGYFYSLTIKGKMAAGKIDTDAHVIEKQPKVSIIIIPHKLIKGKQMFLVQQRRKEPYFGYWGFMTGKIRYGQTVFEVAQRELKEEMGISAKFKFSYELHEMVYDKKTKEQLEDKFFHVLEATNLKGEIIENTKEGHNKFVTIDEFRKMKPKYHNEDDILSWLLNKNHSFKEEKYYIKKF